MLRKKISAIIGLIKAGKAFSCMAEDRSFTIIVDEFVPYICTAIHDGGNTSAVVRKKITLSKFERWQEEDPYTGDFISSLPIRIIAHDSRYEYDLNRSPEECIYREAWGKDVWNISLNSREITSAKRKHTNYYKVISALVAKLEEMFGACLVFDIHSYNYKRLSEVAPLFNVGTTKVSKKFTKYSLEWVKYLSDVSLPFVDNITKENEVFFGKGYQLQYLHSHFDNTLVLATEIKKVFVDEESGDTFPEIIQSLKEELKRVITLQAKFFANNATNITVKRSHGLLSSEISSTVIDVDKQVFRLMKSFDVLTFVSPVNIESQKRIFFKNKFKKNPDFEYQPLHIDASSLKRELYSIPIHNINDVTLEGLYSGVIDSYCDQIDFLSCRESERFLYSSLKYYGEPTESDLNVARFLLISPGIEKMSDELILVDSKFALAECQEMIDLYRFNGKARISKNLVAKAAFLPSKNLLRVKSGIKVTQRYANALSHHEVGVHMLTTENAKQQPLKILELGLPLDTKTQEGLAILSELLSGNMSLERLQELALRVMAVNHMIKNYNFADTFEYLVDGFGVDYEKAYYLTLRAYRGGGFTKDHLYLRGFKEIYNLYLGQPEQLRYLLIGKTSIEFLSTLSELVARGMLNEPSYTPISFQSPKKSGCPLLEYVVSVFDNKGR